MAKLDAFQALERENYLWSGSMAGLIAAAGVLCVGGLISPRWVEHAIGWEREPFAIIIFIVACSLVGRNIGRLYWRVSDAGKAAQ